MDGLVGPRPALGLGVGVGVGVGEGGGEVRDQTNKDVPSWYPPDLT